MFLLVVRLLRRTVDFVASFKSSFVNGKQYLEFGTLIRVNSKINLQSTIELSLTWVLKSDTYLTLKSLR